MLMILLVVVVVVCFVYVSRQPDEFRISRSQVFAAPAAKVFENINDLHKWDAWSPWAKLDPQSTSSFAGAESGVGASMSWSGNNKVGQGSMTITESRPNELIKLRLEFLKPMKATNTAEFIFKEQGGQTTVTWTMLGTNSFMGKLVGVLMNCEKMVGGQFEKGFSSLKEVVERK